MASASDASNGAGGSAQTEEELNHRLHLPFFGAAVADDRLLHFGGRVFHDRHAGFHSGEHRDAARVPQLERASRIDGVKQIFDGDAVGTVPRDAARRARRE